MTENEGKVRVRDAVLANMVSIAAILEYLETQNPGSKAAIERRAQDIARQIASQNEQRPSDEEEGLEDNIQTTN